MCYSPLLSFLLVSFIPCESTFFFAFFFSVEPFSNVPDRRRSLLLIQPSRWQKQLHVEHGRINFLMVDTVHPRRRLCVCIGTLLSFTFSCFLSPRYSKNPPCSWLTLIFFFFFSLLLFPFFPHLFLPFLCRALLL